MGYICLQGGAEFGGYMAESDRRALELAGGRDARVVILPTAAAPDNNHQRAGANGERWFRSLGARDVEVLPLIDRAFAESRVLAKKIADATLIYLLGGFTHYLGQALVDTECHAGMQAAHRHGAAIAGSSAGAMVLCEHYYDPHTGRIERGLGFVGNACVVPHHDTFGKRWAPRLRELLPGAILLGIDERTGMIDDRAVEDACLGVAGEREWRVLGQGAVTVYEPAGAMEFPHGAHFSF